ncbi:MAG: bifunctional folylpolyglutamate synthase/dihydrofolate synthase [Deltaproteobacteria bacterium]|nr:bifunctional folylpolyglutamate synthase/dihydrofolate synthase [Deltaproteobacteria bacterium]MDQ3299915.1 Mur ligase family protein [Myxococcota bacterium]
MSAYAELLARLLPARRFGIVLGLDRIRALLDALGSPDTRLGTVIHVGGTNGKGSTVAMIAALVRAGGLRVATYTSPHLSSLRERIVIDGELIAEAALVAAADRVRAHGGDELTFFEQLTAMACVAIADAHVDVSILEVGLGGRLDATNAIAAPIAVVTGVAMDHEAILGETLAAIAAEKAGIFKPGQRIVIGVSGEPEAVPLLEQAAVHAQVSTITMIGSPDELQLDDALANLALTGMGPQPIRVVDESALERVPPLGLAGAHQRRNAAAALAALDQLAALGVLRLDTTTRARALAGVVHPGRFEVIAGEPPIILDGAHNPHGAAALAATLRERDLRPVAILAVSADKDVRSIIRELAPAVSAFVATRYQLERALDPAALAAVIEEATSVPVETAADLAAADTLARTHAAPILVAGSLFIVGEARVRYLDAPADPIAVSDPSASARQD